MIVDAKEIEVAQIGAIMDLGGGGGEKFGDSSIDLQNLLKVTIPADCLQHIQYIEHVYP